MEVWVGIQRRTCVQTQGLLCTNIFIKVMKNKATRFTLSSQGSELICARVNNLWDPSVM